MKILLDDYDDLRQVLKKHGMTPIKHYALPLLLSLPPHEGLERGIEITSFDDLMKLYRGYGEPLMDGDIGVLVHIMHTRLGYFELLRRLSGSKRLPRVHLVWCRTLEDMKEQKRYTTRYVKTRNNGGRFLLTSNNDKEVSRNLHTCLNCLDIIKRKDYKNFGPRNFPHEDFLNKYGSEDRFLKDLPDYIVAPTRGGNFQKNRKRALERDGYKCQTCGVKILPTRGLLEVHHADKNPGNDRMENLKTLCCICHAEEHLDLGIAECTKEQRETILQLRHEQGLL